MVRGIDAFDELVVEGLGGVTFMKRGGRGVPSSLDNGDFGVRDVF